MLTVQWLVCALSLAVNTPDAGAAGPAPLIPRETLFGSVEKTLARLSPDGRKLAYLATDAHGVLQIQVRTVGSSDDVAVTQEPHRSLRWFTWAEDSKTILFTHDALGDENTHLFSIDLATGNTRDLTPWAGIRASLLRTDARHPDEVLITLNLRDRTQTDVWRVNLKTGATELDTQNPGDVAEWRVDATFTVRAAIAILPDGSTDVRLRESNRAPFKSWVTAGPEENLTFIDFTNDGRSAFLATSISTDMQRIVEKGLKTGTERLLSQNPASDPVAFFVSEQKHVINAVAFEVAGRQEWTTLEYGVKGDFEALKKTLTGDFRVESADRAETTWVVSVVNDRAPTAWYLWDRKGRRLTPLFTERPRLEGQSLAAMTPLTVTARDGLKLTGFLTLPPNGPARPPLVVLVHGGPWARDRWEFSSPAQWLANRGAAVLQLNFRGSTGSGKQFTNAGNRQWGLSMHTDVLDAVTQLGQQGLIDVNAVAMLGADYGGYETVIALTRSADVFKCGVAFAPSLHLPSMMQSLPPRLSALRALMYRRIGNPNDPAELQLLNRASPALNQERLSAPLLLGSGQNDLRVPRADLETWATTALKAGAPLSWAEYPDEGHTLVQAAHRLDFFARAEALLTRCLNTRLEPMPPSNVSQVVLHENAGAH